MIFEPLPLKLQEANPSSTPFPSPSPSQGANTTTSLDSPPQTSDRDQVLTRLINASPDKVFRAWTEPVMLKRRFAPLPCKPMRLAKGQVWPVVADRAARIGHHAGRPGCGPGQPRHAGHDDDGQDRHCGFGNSPRHDARLDSTLIYSLKQAWHRALSTPRS